MKELSLLLLFPLRDPEVVLDFIKVLPDVRHRNEEDDLLLNNVIKY